MLYQIIMSVFVICISTAIILIWYMGKSFDHWKNRNIPFVKPVIPIGNIASILLGKECIGVHARNIYKQLKQRKLKFGGYFVFHKPVLMIVDPVLVKKILISDFSYFEDRGTYYDEEIDPLSGHLFSVDNPKWFNLRKKFSPLFSSAKLKVMFQTVLDCSKNLKAVMDHISNTGEPSDIKNILARYTLDVISSVAFGIECNSLKNPNVELQKIGKSFFDTSFRNSFVFTCGLVCPKILHLLKIPMCESEIAKYFLEVMKYTVETREKNNIERNDMLNLLIKLKNNEEVDDSGNSEKNSNFKISFIDLAAQSFVFFIAGYETSSATMSFTLYEISKNENIQEKMRDEILKTLIKYNGEITYEAVMEMKYLDCVVKETLRKYPPLSFLNRQCVRDYKIPGTDTVIEKGTSIVISSLGIQTDPDFYENPQLYDPERFNPERKEYLKENCYMPFGLGPRNCIGMRFGKLQTKTGLIALLKDYTFSLDPRTNPEPQLNRKCFSLVFEDPIWLRVTKL